MDRFTKDHKFFDLIEKNWNLIPIIHRFALNFGNNDQSVGQVCAKQNINIDFFLAIINTYHNKGYFPEKELKSFSPLLIIDYLKETHSYYAKNLLPKLERLLDKLIQSSSGDSQHLSLIKKFYNEYISELIIHIKEEEELVFPYITQLCSGLEPTFNYTIHSFEKDHSNVDIKINDLKRLIIEYLEPSYDNKACAEFLTSLYLFEQDIKDHARIEDKILVPQVIEIEKHING